MASIDKRPLKAYVRFDGAGRVVPSSLVLRRKMPKVGKWIEVPGYQCCNPTTTTTTAVPELPCIQYVAMVSGDASATLTYTNCENIFTQVIIPGPGEVLFCALSGTQSISRNGIIIPLGNCTTTTTTTLEVTTTTTTTAA